MVFNNGLVCGVCVLLCCHCFFIVVFKDSEREASRPMSDVWKNRFSSSKTFLVNQKSKNLNVQRTIEFQHFVPTISEWNEGLEAYTRKYVENTPEVKRSGLARVIPPKEWKWLRKSAFENVNDETFKPIRQCTSTRAGVTRCQIQEMKTSTISEFETFVKKSHATPSNIEEKLKRNDNIIDEDCIATIERAFWKTSLSHTSKPGVYGADIKASLFEKDVEACGRGWNFSNLESILTRGLSKEERENLHGVASSYLYVGSWGSMFAWHTEDYELNSINYIHHGKPKVWYSIPPAYAKRFECVAASLFAAESKECPEFPSSQDMHDLTDKNSILWYSRVSTSMLRGTTHDYLS